MESEKTVGTILREARLAKGLSLTDLEKTIRVRASYLEALENDDYDKLPSAVFVKGMIRNYGSAVGCDGLALIELFKESNVGKQKVAGDAKGIREVDNVSLHIQLKEKRDIGSGNGKIELPSFINLKQIGVGFVMCAVLAVGFFAGPSIYKAVSSFTLPSFSSSSDVEKKEIPNVAVKPIADKVVVDLESAGSCWLEVTADGKSIFEGMLQAKDKKTFEAKDKLIAKYGNIGVVKVSVNGEVVDYVGEHGVAVKTYLREGAVASEPPSVQEQSKVEQVVQPQVAPEAKADIVSEQKVEVAPETKVEVVPEQKVEVVPEAEVEVAPELKVEEKVTAPVKVEEPVKVESTKEENK